jgi:Na+-translocating ferredoxin:NAD+ oxidoreductase RnfC subunit
VEKYYDYKIDTLRSVEPASVDIPLKQHIGAPCEPVVKAGDHVTRGQLIGACPEKALGADIHAGIPGVVGSVSASSVVIERGRN